MSLNLPVLGSIDRIHRQTFPLLFLPHHQLVITKKRPGIVVFFGVDVPSNGEDIECFGRLTFSSLFLPHHQLVIMKAESLVRRQIVNAETDR